MNDTGNTVKTGNFYKGLFLSLLLLAVGNLHQVSAQSTCTSANMILVGATDFECTYDYGVGQTHHELQHTKFYGPSGATMRMAGRYVYTENPALVGTPLGANANTTKYYGVVKNPADLGRGLPSIDKSMIVMPWPSSAESAMIFEVGGLNSNAPVRVVIEGYYLATTSCAAPTALMLAFNIRDGVPNGSPNPQINLTGTVGIGNKFTGSVSTTIAGGLAQASITIQGAYHPNNCGMIGISKIEVWSCPDIVVISQESEEMCTGEQTRLFLDRDYATSSLKWEKSTNGTNYAEILGTAGMASILEEVTQNTWYRCTVSGVVSKALAIKTITCCTNSEGLATSRKVVYHETFGVFNGPRDYVDAQGKTTWVSPIDGQTYPYVMGDNCARLPAIVGYPSGVQGHTFSCTVTDMGHYSVNPWAGLNPWYMQGCIKSDASNNTRGGILSIDVANRMAGVIYERLITGLCSGKEIYFQIAFAPGASGSTNAQIAATITRTDGSPLSNPTPRTTLVTKRQNGGFTCGWNIIKTDPFILPAGVSEVYMQLCSYGTAWNSNEDLNFDDIKFMVCSPPNIEVYSDLEKVKQDTTICGPTTLEVATKLSELAIKTYGGIENVRYIFQWSTDKVNWNNIGSGAAAIRTVSSVLVDSEDYPFPMTYFRLAVATEGSLMEYVTNPNYESFEDNCRNTSVSQPFVLIKANSLNGMEEVTIPACKGDQLTLSGPTAAIEPKIVSWGWADASGTIIVPISSNAANRNYNYTFSGTGSSATFYFIGNSSNCSARKKFTITEKSTVTINLNQQQDCGKTTITATSTPASGVTYEWAYTGGAAITATGPSIVLNSPAYTNGTVTVTGKATGYCDSSPVTQAVTINIIPPPPTVAKSVVSYQMEAGSVDISSDVGVLLSSILPGSTIVWRNAGTSPTAPGTVVSPPMQSKAAEGTYYFWVVQVTPQGCRDSIQVRVIISEVPTPKVQETSVCQGQPLTVNLATLVDPNPEPATYELVWYTTATGGTGSTTPPASATINTSAYGEQFVYVTFREIGDPTKESARVPIKITVIQTPTVNSPGNQTKCNGAQTDAVNFTGNITSGVTYNWTNSNTAIGLAASGSGNIAQFTATNTINAAISTTIRVTPTYNTCTGTPVDFTITVNPTPTVDKPTNQAKCKDTATDAVNFTGNMSSGVTYNWTNNNPDIGLAGSGNGNIASFTATNTTNSQIIGTVTVTPTAAGCPGTPQSFSITVNPTPTVTNPGNQSKCNGATTDAVNFTGNIPSGVTYDWTNDNTAIGLAASGNTNIASFTATNSTTSPISGTIRVTPTISGCTGASQSFTITVNPAPMVNPIANQAKCNGDQTDAVSFSSNIPSGVTYSWTNNNTAIGLAANGTGDNIAPFKATNTTTSPISGTITVTPTSTGCPGVSSTFTITVNPTPTVNINNHANATEITCTRTNIDLTATGGVNYSWDGGLGNSANATVTTAGTYTVTATDANGCINTKNITITENKLTPNALITNSTTILTCAEPSITLTASGGVNYSWSNGSVNAVTTVTADGTYTVTVTSDNGCSADKSITITSNKLLPNVSVNHPEICLGDSAILTASGADVYTWNTGDTGASITVAPTASTTYTVEGTVTATGCKDNAKTDVYVEAPIGLTLSAPKSVELGKELTITVYAERTDHGYFEWFINSEPYKTVSENILTLRPEPGKQHFLVQTATARLNCPSSSEIYVEVSEFIPNAFNPYNPDGSNNYFMKGYHVEIYNRYMQKVFEGNDGWDGTYRGAIADPGTYFFRIFKKNGQVAKGTLEVVKF